MSNNSKDDNNKYEYDPSNLFDTTQDDLDEYQYYKGCSPVPYKSNDLNQYNYAPPIDNILNYQEMSLEDFEEMHDNGEIDDDTYNEVKNQLDMYQQSTNDANNIYSGLVNVYQTLAKLFNMSAGNYYDEYNIAHDEENQWCVDTCEVDEDEKGYRYETAVAHLDFNHGRFVIVQGTDDEDAARDIHNKWVNDLKKDKINLLVDINTNEVYMRKGYKPHRENSNEDDDNKKH